MIFPLNGLHLIYAIPWSTAFNLGSSDRPFLAFIEVENNGAGAVTVYIRENGSIEDSGTVPAGGTLGLYAIIE